MWINTSRYYNHGQKSWDTFAFLGCFSPHKQCWTRVSRIFFRVSTLDRVAGGTTARKCRKGCTVLRGNREMTEKYKYCSTVPRTFVQDCSSFLPFIFLFRLSSSSLIAVISSSRSRRNWKKHRNNKTRHPSLLRRDLTKQRRRGQRQKAISLVSKTTTLHMHHASCTLFLPSLHDYDVKCPNLFWWRDDKAINSTISVWTRAWPPLFSSNINSLWKIAKWFERVQSLFFRDVFMDVAVVRL